MTGIKHFSIAKPQVDKREYRGLQLPNGLRAVVVSDPTCEIAAAALNVNIGAMADPDNIPGLAHFCEHMLFLGTEKYPEVGGFDEFLCQNGGGSNAFTEVHATTYYFTVSSEKLTPALDMFAQFFLAPLFTEEYTSRELQAVNSEHEKNIPDDDWRQFELDRVTCVSKHPISRFSTGNRFTLEVNPREKGINVREALLEFHGKYYSSNIMNLTVLGKESLDELEQLAIGLFSEIKNINAKPLVFDFHPYDEHTGLMIKGVPIKDAHTLCLAFAWPDVIDDYKSAPEKYVLDLIGHEGPGSIALLLKKKCLANSLSVDHNNGNVPRCGSLQVVIDLTDKGLESIDEILEIFFQYIAMLKREGPKRWVFDELKTIYANKFRFRDTRDVESSVLDICKNLLTFPIEEALCCKYVLDEWKPDLVQKLIDCLTPKNLRVMLTSPTIENQTNRVEEYYQIHYTVDKLTDKLIGKLENVTPNVKLTLPPVNEYIPTEFDLFPQPIEPKKFPEIIYDSPVIRVWFKQDDMFLLPKLTQSFLIASPLIHSDPLNYVSAYVFVDLLEIIVEEHTYTAKLAGIDWKLALTTHGIEIKTKGFNHKQDRLAVKIIDEMINFRVKNDQFISVKESYERTLKNYKTEMPCRQVIFHMESLLSENAWSKLELLAALQTLTAEKLQQFVGLLLSRMHVECLVHGNVQSENALTFAKNLEEKIQTCAITPLLARQLLPSRGLKLEDGCNYVLTMKNDVVVSSSICIYYQFDMRSIANAALCDLYQQVIAQKCFHILRTMEQLGYIVRSQSVSPNGIVALRIIIQSDRHPNYLEQRIDNFNHEMEKYIAEMDDDEFLSHVEALATIRLERPKLLAELSARYWTEIVKQQYCFDRNNLFVEHLRKLKRDDVLTFYRTYISEKSDVTRRLQLHLISTTTETKMVECGDANIVTPARTSVESVSEFKRSKGLFPLLAPYIDVPMKGQHA